MFTSAHWGEQLPWGGSIDFSRNTPWNEAEYPSGASRSYPRAYVALNKHANYHTRAACDGGGYHNSDDCTTNYDTGRFTIPAGFTWEQRNVGSSEVPRIDRQTSIAGYPGVEWFWDSALNFCGWSNSSSAPADRQGCASPYQNVLSFYGF